jgi:hypothetical protein
MLRSSALHLPAALALALVLGLVGVVGACGNENPKLMVTGIEPDRGDAEGGTYVRVRGNRFTADGPRTAKIYFGGRQGSVVRWESDSVMIVQAPGGKPNEVVDVLFVFDPGGQLRVPGAFRFVEKTHNAPSVDDLNINKDGKDSKDKK